MKLKIPGFSNYYLETDDNRVYNQRERPLKETISYDEYKNRGVETFTLKNDDGVFKHVRKHRLVYQAYHPEEDISDLQINHLDENTLNNCIDNLEACTCKENINHGTGNYRRSIAMKGRPNVSVMVSVKATVIETGEVEYYESITSAARHLNSHLTTIRAALIGKSKQSCGRYWDYYHGN